MVQLPTNLCRVIVKVRHCYTFGSGELPQPKMGRFVEA